MKRSCDSLQIEVPSTTENLANVRDFVREIVQPCELGKVELNRLLMAVDEACANVIEHVYQNDRTQVVLVDGMVEGDRIVFEIIDQGPQFDAREVHSEAPSDLIAQRAKGGLGLRLIRTLVDRVDYEPGGSRGNVLRLTKLR